MFELVQGEGQSLGVWQTLTEAQWRGSVSRVSLGLGARRLRRAMAWLARRLAAITVAVLRCCGLLRYDGAPTYSYALALR